jgi:hypothetical protein
MAIRYPVFFLLFFCACLRTGIAESSEPAQNAPSHFESNYVFRTGEQLQGPQVLTYRLFEYSLQAGHRILPDIGYYDTGGLSDRIIFGGGGVEYKNRHIDYTQILYAAEETGPSAHHQRTLWIWPVIDSTYTPRLTSEVALYPTIPINHAARWGFDIDRAKMEYAFGPHFKAGAGLSACVGATTSWTNKPLATATFTNRGGAWEFWLERMPGGAQIQLRYSLTRKGF